MPKSHTVEELPAESGEGHSTRPLPHRPGFAELPPGPDYYLSREAVVELFRLRDRMHAMESQLLAAKLRIRNPNIHELPYIETVLRGGLPNELPEGGEMGGGGVFRPIHEIAELPPWEQFMNLARVLETITQRLNSVEAGVAALNAKLDTAG